MKKHNVYKPLYSEEYKIKFWIKNDAGFSEQREESYYFESKNKHKQVAKIVKEKYKKLNKKIEIISVVYQ